MKKIFLLLGAVALLLSSCAVQSPFGYSEEYFQALGREGDIVVTMDVERTKDSQFASFLSSVPDIVLSRSERISIAMTPEGEGWTMVGAAEGNFPRSLVSTALDWSTSFRSIEEYAYRAKDGSLEAAIPRNGILLFAEDDILGHKDRTWDNRTLYIDGGTAREMAEAPLALYSLKPVRIPELFIEFPDSVTAKTEAFLLLIDAGHVSGWMKMDSESSASTLLKLFRNELVKAVRQRGEKLDTKLLSTYFQTDGDTVRLDFPMEVFTAVKEGSNAAL